MPTTNDQELNKFLNYIAESDNRIEMKEICQRMVDNNQFKTSVLSLAIYLVAKFPTMFLNVLPAARIVAISIDELDKLLNLEEMPIDNKTKH
jgi:hypothetical protein